MADFSQPHEEQAVEHRLLPVFVSSTLNPVGTGREGAVYLPDRRIWNSPGTVTCLYVRRPNAGE